MKYVTQSSTTTAITSKFKKGVINNETKAIDLESYNVSQSSVIREKSYLKKLSVKKTHSISRYIAYIESNNEAR